MSTMFKKRKNDNYSSLVPLIQTSTLKREPFTLNISSSGISTPGQDSVGFTYVIAQHNPDVSTNGSIKLPGTWQCGISNFIINNELISFKKIADRSIGLLYLVVKESGTSSARVLPIIYFEHALYSKNEAVNYANKKLEEIWLHLCYPCSDSGINLVGQVFATTIFRFHESSVDDYIYIKSLGSTHADKNKKAWNLFKDLFAEYRKTPGSTLEYISVFTSTELLKFYGTFKIPKEVEGFKEDRDFHEKFEGVRITERIAVVPFPGKGVSSSCVSIRATNIVPFMKPLGLNILTNILGQDKTTIVNITDRTFARFKLLGSIPLQTFARDLPGISYSPSEILYKNLPSDCRIDEISIYITDTQSQRLISLNTGDSYISLEFVPT